MRNKQVPSEKPLVTARNRTRSRRASGPIRPLPSPVATDVSEEASPELDDSSAESQQALSPAPFGAPARPSESGDLPVATDVSEEVSPELDDTSAESQQALSPAPLGAPTRPSESGDPRSSGASDGKSWQVFAQACDVMIRPMEMLLVIALGLCSGHRTPRTRRSKQLNNPA
jgi:hypothetical protein